MRVIAGKARRLPLKTIEGMDTRPTTDRIKETLFNMIGQEIYDVSFLDLFSGSGGIGIEALSRGAAECIFVENNPKAVSCIKENLAFTRLENGKIMSMEAMTALKRMEGREAFSFIFMDPPYASGLEDSLFPYLAESSLADEETRIIVEAVKDKDFSFIEEYGFYVEREKLYKTNKHMWIRRR